MLFYEVFRWYKTQHGKELNFVSGTRIKLGKNAKNWSTCLFENDVSNQFCDKLTIQFEFKSFSKHSPAFVIGYATGDSIEQSISEWECPLGGGDMKHTSFGWLMSGYNTLAHAGNGHQLEMISMSMKYSEGDIFTIIFDFIEKEIVLHRNKIELNCQDFNADKIWIGVSMYGEGTEIELIDYEYD